MNRSTFRHLITAAALLAAVGAGACSTANEGATPDSAADTLAVAPSASTTPAAQSGLLDPNSASREQIAALPGLTPALADSIIARRPYRSMAAVDSLLAPSLAEAQRDSVYARMFVPISLNSAGDAEILLIPGVGPRMLREFKEYRPYDDIARFRREIGKYVDSTEVARLEQYVRVP